MLDVENTQARLLVGNMVGVDDAGNNYLTGELRFIPGINHVKDEDWEACKQNKNTQTWVRLGWLKEYGSTPAAQDVDEDISIEDLMAEASKMPANELVATIEALGLEHRQVLETLAERDNRASVVLAAKLRLDALDPKLPTKE